MGFPWATAFSAVPQQQSVPPATNSKAVFPVQTSAFPTSSEQTTSAPLPQAQSTNLFLSDPGGEYATLSTAQSGLPSQVSLPNQQAPHIGIPTHPSPLKGDVPSQPSPTLGRIPTQQTQPQTTQPQTGIHTTSNVIPSNDLFISPSIEIPMQSAPPIPSRQHRSAGGPAQTQSGVDDARLNIVQGELKEANDKINDYENKLQVSEEKLSLAEREKIRLEKVTNKPPSLISPPF